MTYHEEAWRKLRVSHAVICCSVEPMKGKYYNIILEATFLKNVQQAESESCLPGVSIYILCSLVVYVSNHASLNVRQLTMLVIFEKFYNNK